MRAGFSAALGIAGIMAAAESSASYRQAIAQWRAQHEAKLKADDGWLTVVALDWLKDGDNRVGSNPDFEVPLPKSAPPLVGILTVRGGTARFKPAAGVPVTLNGQPARETELRPDTEPKYDVLAVGRVKFFIIKRDDKLAVRVKDNDSVIRRQFTGLHWFPVDAAWRIQAKYVPWDKPRAVMFNSTNGVHETDQSPGYVAFQHEGKEYRLEPVIDEGELWFIMRDATSGKTTYGASRFLYADLPKDLTKPGTVEIDFNKAENPPCVFTNYATCPLPPPQNRLSLAVTAGEQMYGDHH
jgi:hypothetical protein